MGNKEKVNLDLTDSFTSALKQGQEQAQKDFSEQCANKEQRLLRQVFRAVIGRKLKLADYKLFKIISLEGQPHRYQIYFQKTRIGEVVKTFSTTEGFTVTFTPNNENKPS